MKRPSLPPIPPRQLRQQSSASATQVLSVNAHDSEDFADVDDGHSDVGFESSTVLLYESAHQPANKLADMPSGSSSISGGNKGASPYAMYEPAYAQQQKAVLRSVLPDETAVTAAGWSGGSVFPAPNASYSHTVLHPPQQPHLLPPPYLSDSLARPTFTTCSSSILGPSTNVEGVSEPPSAPGYSPPTTVAEPSTGASAKAAASTEVLEVPLHAPRLRVPANLPLEQTTLLDLIATAVVQGGPTTEEEIVKREVGRGNPAFAFLGEKFNHPCMLYYRWRLYSLLQGDTLLSWRTQPFQIEEARRAYVWVPPPALKVGPECLVGLHQPELLDTALATGSGGDAVATLGDVDDEDETDVIVRTGSRRRRRRHHRSRDAEDEANSRRSRREAGDEGGHGSCRRSGRSSSGSSTPTSSSSSSSESDVEQSEPKGSGATSAAHADGDEKRRAKRQPTGPSLAGTSIEAPSSEAAADAARLRLPPPSAQWISRQCTAHRHVFSILQPHLLKTWAALLDPYAIADPVTVSDNGIATLCQRWLRRDEVASRMMFAIRHADAIHHLLSVLLDAVVKVAYVATARSRQQPTTSVDPLDSNIYCVEAVWYLFVLHDIAMNASNMPEVSATSATSVNKSVSSRQQGLQSEHALSTAAGVASGTASVGRIDADEELFASEGSPEGLEALYEAFRREHLSTRAGTSTPPSPAAAAGAATVVSPSSALGSTPRPRRRQRHPQRRSSYERCGDALEMILPTLIESCTAIALAVSMDKERHRSQAAATGPAAAARVRHFKVLPPQQQHQHQQQSKVRDKSKVAEHEPMMASPSTTLHVGGGPALSLRLDAGCDATASSSSRSTISLSSSSAEDSVGTAAGAGAGTAMSSTSSAPAVMLLHWLKTFLIVWMNAEQPLQPPPSSPPAVTKTVARAVAPPGTVWPDCQADAADLPDVNLTYHVDPQRASLLGLGAASLQQRNAYHQPPLLSARACAILKDRYSFLF